ncbi:MAG: phosphoribosylglycinamide formyltransferase [Chloroflexi bacterium]|nr:phosphoribosylglycinamide formyltransferase [Chloroflexota bacterium]
MSLLRVGVLISGRGSNLQAILDAIARGELAAGVAVVGSNRADAAGLERARRAGVPTVVADRAEFPMRAERQARLLEALDAHDVELLVLAGFDEILGPALLGRFPGRVLNIHPSLLPAFGGGMHAARDALAYGVKVSGCTVHFVTADVDQGPIVLQAAVPVEEADDELALAARILEQEHRLLPHAVQLFAEGRLALEGRRVRILDAAALPAALG